MRSLLILSTGIIAAGFAIAATGSGLNVTSPVFNNNGMIPHKYSCDGDNVNPPLSIEHLPVGTKTVALIVHDPDAPVKGGFTHWVAWNIKPGLLITENYKDAEQGLNGSGKKGYTGMCPPSGTHHYHFMAYALDVTLNIDKRTDKKYLEKAMQGHILAQGDLVGLYKK
ncbi:MAG: hypothetical protein BGO70_01945 [Bacteroidetes bacterium 43-93]|nr:YbhB/YbcL family Raf kinase inhibitor-like protein [Bacteroidota bacterium]OJW96466.1 MAG: hypothetical protein BGO70_01945 [Bacteroidetes bacterium 43-93]